MKRFGLFLIGITVFIACTKEDEVEKPVVVNEPVASTTSLELTGEFEGEWDSEGAAPKSGSITVNDRHIFIDELPTDSIIKGITMLVKFACQNHPERQNQLIDSIGNIFFASDYKFPKTGLEINYQLGSFDDGSYHASISSVKNMWSDITTTIIIDKVPPYPSETIVIGPPEPGTISFGIEADGVPYRIDLVSKEHKLTAEFIMETSPWSLTGMWILQYRFCTYRFYNLETGQKLDYSFSSHYPLDKDDCVQLLFHANKRLEDIEERIVFH